MRAENTSRVLVSFDIMNIGFVASYLTATSLRANSIVSVLFVVFMDYCNTLASVCPSKQMLLCRCRMA